MTEQQVNKDLLKVYNRVKRKRAKDKLYKRIFNKNVDTFGDRYDKIGICELCNETQKLRLNMSTNEMLCDTCDIATKHSLDLANICTHSFHNNNEVFELINDYRLLPQ